MATKKTTKKAGRAVLVTTAHRGVFFGYADKIDGETIALKRSRLCLRRCRVTAPSQGEARRCPTKAARGNAWRVTPWWGSSQ